MMKTTPIVVVYNAIDIKTGSDIIGNHLISVDKFPITMAQWMPIKEMICEQKGVHELIILNIIPLRSEEVQGDE